MKRLVTVLLFVSFYFIWGAFVFNYLHSKIIKAEKYNKRIIEMPYIKKEES